MIDREFRIGDRVTCNMFGLGEVIKISYNYVYVEFLSGVIENFLLDGKRFAHSKRTLFILQPIKPTKQKVKKSLNNY